MPEIPSYREWFPQARFGLFIHWGPYAAYGRGEQVLFRENLDQRQYAERARRWNPRKFDPHAWASTAKGAGAKYAVFTSRHHDGYCNWDSRLTDYSSGSQAPRRDFVREYTEAFRDAGLRVGLYYSLADWRIPAYWQGPARDPEGWNAFRTYVHGQVAELLTNYGRIDVIWFDGPWPHSQDEWKSAELVELIRSLQPHILINDRLGSEPSGTAPSGSGTGRARNLGDFGTPEHQIAAVPGRLWESCQVSTWRLWGYASGERWRPADLLLDMLVEATSKGGNLLINVGPDGDGQFPQEFNEKAVTIGRWLDAHGEAIYDTEGGDICEFITHGRQTCKGNNLYLIIRFWDGQGCLRLAGLDSRVRSSLLLTTGQELPYEQSTDHLIIRGLPREPPTDLFPVIRLECEGPPRPRPWAADRLWQGDPRRMAAWAAARGTSV